jgi:predicted amidophosphoribosyltransferase
MTQNKKMVKDISALDDSEFTVICKHCGKSIDRVNLIGFSLICPLCGKPQNGEVHLKAKNTIKK